MLHQIAEGILDGEAVILKGLLIEPVDYITLLAELVGSILFCSSADFNCIRAFTGTCFNDMLTAQRNFEYEYRPAFLLGKERTVHIQFHSRLIGVDLYFRLILTAVDISASAQMHECILLIPGCFVQIERIFLNSSVHGHKTLLVHTVLAAFISAVCREVEHIPDVGCPQIRSFFDALENVLMIDALVCFAVITALGIGILILRVGICTVFGETDDTLRILGMVFIKEGIVLFQFTEIPSEVEIIAGKVSNRDQFTFLLKHECMCHDSRSCRIHSVAEIIQLTVIFHQAFRYFAGCGDFIGKSPAYDGRMVVALCDQFTHLGDGILSAVVHMHCDIRNLSPYDHTVFITEIIEFLGMLVMGKTNRIGADFTDHLHVFSVFLNGQGIAELGSVLVS